MKRAFVESKIFRSKNTNRILGYLTILIFILMWFKNVPVVLCVIFLSFSFFSLFLMVLVISDIMALVRHSWIFSINKIEKLV